MTLERRPLWKRRLLTPAIFWKHYCICRRSLSVWQAAWGAWRLAQITWSREP